MCMAHISDADRSVFAEAHNTVLDNFTDEEQEQLHSIAKQLGAVLVAAKKRASGGYGSKAYGKGAYGQ
jgi:hypothetical protein